MMLSKALLIRLCSIASVLAVAMSMIPVVVSQFLMGFLHTSARTLRASDNVAGACRDF